MTILQLCNKMPYPPRDGGAIATLTLTESMASLGHNMVILAMNTEKHHFNVNQLPEKEKSYAEWHTVNVKANFSLLEAASAFINNQSYHIKRYISLAFEKRLIELLKTHNPQWVQLEGLYLTPYITTIRKHSQAKISLRAHNVEFMIWEGIAAATVTPIKKIYLAILTKQLKKYEIEQLNKCDALLPITPDDAHVFEDLGCKKPQHICPVAINKDLLSYNSTNSVQRSLFFIGSLDWIPNLEGLQWFLQKVWPQIHEQFPTIPFYIAGRNPHPSIQNIHLPNVDVLGEIEDAKLFMSSHGIMLVPLLSGSGVRVKILEGMALGKAIITTSIGAKGLSVTTNKEILIADTVDEFTKYIAKCLENEAFCSNIGLNGKQFVAKQYNSITIAQSLSTFYNTLYL